ncbi:hypothetical protein N7474_002139 [Penicillium riverlandense]|uniref:uncharacterized protein n=1 Tax=Penicillium riverlandense TaxID=1903569 RepID=UPI0025493A61|nr:uncharacterized protein N7474_002139 [Penicillium riverlandense]KAJ5833828.1 hypothetical protein N7474_002139 [Penicillium riverlandense]
MSSLPSQQETPTSQDLSSLYVRTHEYTAAPKYPSNSAVRYFVPPDDNNDSSSDTVVVDNKVFNPASHTFADDEFICPGFFERAQLDGFTRRFNHAQWSYEMRREAQPVLPFLSLGPSSCLRERDTLRAQGFTLLLAIRNRHSAQARLVSGDKAAAELGVMADTVDVLDNQELISAFPRAIRRINDHLAGVDNAPAPTSPEQKKKVLVFCESGNERSASVVIAYLMVMLNMDAAHAIHMIQQHRFCVSIEDTLKRTLVAFESILVAKRDVEHTRRTSIPSAAAPTYLAPPPMPMPLAKKRSFQDRIYDDNDDDQVMADSEMDLDREEEFLAERRPTAPFQDRVV